jgi:hypothetical protein
MAKSCGGNFSRTFFILKGALRKKVFPDVDPELLIWFKLLSKKMVPILQKKIGPDVRSSIIVLFLTNPFGTANALKNPI